MSKKLLSVSFALVLLLAAVPAFSSLQCTMQCLAENQLCDEGPTVCALLFEACIDICNDPIFQEGGVQIADDGLDFLQSEPWFVRAESVGCATSP